MAKNEELYASGKKVLAGILIQQGMPFKTGVSEAEKAQLRFDQPERIRLNLGKTILYAYDFRVSADVRGRFEKAVDETKQVGRQSACAEQYVSHGSVLQEDNPDVEIIGWYLTKIPRAS